MSSVLDDVDVNCKKVLNLIAQKLNPETDVLVLPEVWTVGWSCKRFIQSAQELSDSSVVSFLSNLAKEYNMNIIGGSFITKDGENYYNTCPVLDRNGKLIAVYNKNHLYSYYGCDEGKFITRGDCPVMVNLDGVNFGLTICYDIRFPEIYRAYRKAGADILVNCAAWGSAKPIPWDVMTKSRAVENQCFMVALSQCGHIEGDEFNLGNSAIIDYKGEVLSSLSDSEDIACADICLDDIYTFRSKCTILNDIKSDYEVKILCEK